jgi:hypothetical protein
MTPDAVLTIEKALETHGRLITAQGERLNQLARMVMDDARERHALERVLQALAAQVAADAQDPLKFLDEVRTKALAPMASVDLTDAREAIERVLAKVEGSLTGPQL